MSQLAIQVKNLTSRLKIVEDMVTKSKSDYQPAPGLCKKYEISRSLRDRLVKEGLLKEYRLFGKIYFKESQIVEIFEGEMAKQAAA